MKYNIHKNWIATAEMMVRSPMVILPFFVIAFIEALILEFAYFSTRHPIAFVMAPIIKKFFGEEMAHYPGSLIILPRLFYYLQTASYILFGVLLTAVSVNVFVNIQNKLPVKVKAMVNNASKRYISFFLFGAMVIAIITLLQKADAFLFIKGTRFISRHLPQIPGQVYYLGNTAFLFIANFILQVFMVSCVPIIVIEKAGLLKALWKSILIGFRDFFTVASLIFLPFLVYLPVMLMKSFSNDLVVRTFPEINLYVSAFGIIIAAFLDCFVILCVSQFIMDKRELGAGSVELGVKK